MLRVLRGIVELVATEKERIVFGLIVEIKVGHIGAGKRAQSENQREDLRDDEGGQRPDNIQQQSYLPQSRPAVR